VNSLRPRTGRRGGGLTARGLALVAAAGIGGGGAPTLAAQPAPTATIEEILLLQGTGRGTVIPGTTDRVLVLEADLGRWTETGAPRTLRLRDQLLVEPRTVVRLTLRSGGGEGRAHLSADPETPDGPAVLVPIGGAGRGLYEISESPEDPDRLEVRVAQGSIALTWLRGRLDLWAAGWRIAITGTEVVLNVNEAGDRAAFHLVEGTVAFPEAPGFSLQPGETALLQVGIPPLLHTGPEPISERLAEASQWSSRNAWPGRNPWVVAGAATGAAAAGYLLWSWVRHGDDSGGQPGTVIVNLPF